MKNYTQVYVKTVLKLLKHIVKLLGQKLPARLRIQRTQHMNIVSYL